MGRRSRARDGVARTRMHWVMARMFVMCEWKAARKCVVLGLGKNDTAKTRGWMS